MQPDWIEPEPLDAAQETGLARVSQDSPLRLPVRYDPRMIQGQIRAEQSRLCGHKPSGALHKAVKYGAYLAAGAVGIFAVVKAGRYLNKKKVESNGSEELLEEDLLEPGMADGEPVEVEEIEAEEIEIEEGDEEEQ